MIRIGCLLLLLSLTYSSQVLAVGLGKMRVLSALDQPLEAEIELISTTPAELNTLRVGLGSRSDFTRAGVEHTEQLSLIEFETGVRDSGDSYVRLTTDEPIVEPFLHFLISLEWAGGKLIREYTALLDPPLYAQGRPASVSSPRLAGQESTGRPVAGQPSPTRDEVGRLPVAPRAQDTGVYGPIGRGETLSEIVDRMILPDGVDLFQAMVAVQQRNPGAFLRGNVNLIKEGSVLELPTAREMAAISKVVASAEYSKQLNEWLAYRSQVAGTQLAVTDTRATPLPSAEGVEGTVDPQVTAVEPDTSGLSEDVLRIIQSDTGPAGDPATGEGGEIDALKSQLAVMEESLLSTELENRELRERLVLLEEQIRETNKLLRVENPGLALAEQQVVQEPESPAPAPTPTPAPDTDAGAAATPSAAEPARVRVGSDSSMFAPLAELMRGDMMWKALLGLAAVVLLIGIIVYIRRRQSYAEFEETMMTGSTYDLRSQSSAFTQVPRMDSVQHSQPSSRANSQSGSLMQTSIMTEMGAPGMGAMQADEVDPVAEAEVYMAYGRDQQAMEVLQDAIRRDPSRHELKIKLLEVYQKRKDVRAFESLAEELYPLVGKDPAKWGRVSEMGKRLSPRHPLFAAAPGAGSSVVESGQATGRRSASSLDRDSSGLDLISAPFSRSAQAAPSSGQPAQTGAPASAGASLDFDAPRTSDSLTTGGGLDLDTDSVSLPFGGDFPGTPQPERPAAGLSTVGGFDQGMDQDSVPMDDFKASEIATKLDLAKAYLEMGDQEAARGFIEEVLKDGNESQRKQASELANSF